MRKLQLIAIVLAGCGTDIALPDASPLDAAPPAVVHVTQDTTWSGTVVLPGAVTIDLCVTVTVAPGTTIAIPQDQTLEVDGLLDASSGTSAQPIAIIPAPDATRFTSVLAASGGEVRLAHTAIRGGALFTQTLGMVTMTDSSLVDAGSNYFAMTGGILDIAYSNLGIADGNDHCIFHLNPGSTNTVHVTHSNIGAAQFGLMLDGGTTATFDHDNWIANHVDVQSTPGAGDVADFSTSYFPGAPPLAAPGNTFTLNDIATTPWSDTGPRP